MVDHQDASSAELFDYLRSVDPSGVIVTVYYSGFFNQEMRENLPSNIVVKYLSRGFLPTNISKVVYPLFSRLKSRFWRKSRPLRIAFSRLRRRFRLIKWHCRRAWNLRTYYLRKTIYFFIRMFSKVSRVIAICRKSVINAIKIYIYKPIKFVFLIFLSMLVEWPLAFLLGVISLRSKKKAIDSVRKGIFRRLITNYYKLSAPLFNRRLERIKGESPDLNFEIICLSSKG